MRPAQRLGERTGIAAHLEQRVIAAIGVGPQNAAKGLQMSLGMFLPPIARGIVKCRRRRLPAQRPVIPDIGPNAARIGLAAGQDRHCGVVSMKPLGGKHMRLDQRVHRLERRGTGSDLVGQCGEAEVDALAGIALALSVQRLVLGELLEQDHHQKRLVRQSRVGSRGRAPAAA